MPVNTISFGPGQQDLQAQQLELQRNQALADALRQQSLQPLQATPNGGPMISKISPWEGIAKLGQAYFSGQMQKNNDAKQAQLGIESAKRQAEALRAVAPPEAGFGDMTPRVPEGSPPDTAFGFTPPQAPTVDPAVRQHWVQLLHAAEANPALGQKLLEQELSAPKWSTTPQYDQQGRAFILSDKGGKPQYLDGIAARDKMENVHGVWINPYKQGDNTFAPQDPNQPFGIGPNGVVPNTAYQQYEMTKAHAGAPSIANKTEVKVGESIAGQVGPILKESYEAARGAQGQIDAANRVLSAIDSNKMYAGPLASTRLKAAQVADMLGVSGQDDQERIANTRQAIRGLAELTLEGRKTMQGQGQITEKESALAEKAMSGNFDEMTPAELRIVANASKRAAEYRVSEHNRKVEMAKKDPTTSKVADYYNVMPIQPAAPQVPVRRWNPATGRIE